MCRRRRIAVSTVIVASVSVVVAEAVAAVTIFMVIAGTWLALHRGSGLIFFSFPFFIFG